MSIFDDIRKDAEAGTPGPWHTGECSWDESTGDVRYTLQDVKSASPVDARRIARVPQLEAIALAAEGCANWCDALIEMVDATSCNPDDPEAFDEVMFGARQFLARYREVTK